LHRRFSLGSHWTLCEALTSLPWPVPTERMRHPGLAPPLRRLVVASVDYKSRTLLGLGLGDRFEASQGGSGSLKGRVERAGKPSRLQGKRASKRRSNLTSSRRAASSKRARGSRDEDALDDSSGDVADGQGLVLPTRDRVEHDGRSDVREGREGSPGRLPGRSGRPCRHRRCSWPGRRELIGRERSLRST
jgi:hypothetical protein